MSPWLIARGNKRKTNRNEKERIRENYGKDSIIQQLDMGAYHAGTV